MILIGPIGMQWNGGEKIVTLSFATAEEAQAFFNSHCFNRTPPAVPPAVDRKVRMGTSE